MTWKTQTYHISVDTVRESKQLDLFTVMLYIDVNMTWQLLPDAFLTECALDYTVQAAHWKIAHYASTDSLMA